MNTLKNLLSLNDDERLLAEVRTYQEKLISNAEEPIWERKWLTIEEAAAYSGIGRTKLRESSRLSLCNMDRQQNPYCEGTTGQIYR